MDRYRPRQGTPISSWRHINYLQDGVQRAFESAFADYIALSQDFFIEGGDIISTPVGSDIQYDISEGYGCFKGEMMPVELISVVKAPTQVVFLEVIDSDDDVQPVVNLDGTLEYVMRKRTLRLKVDNVYPASYVDIGAPRKSTLDILRYKGRLMMPGAMTPYYGPMTNFSIDGLGISGSIMDGWAICNGLNGTPDMRGMIPIGATNVPDSGAPSFFGGVQQATNVGQKVGADTLQLNADHLPEHTHQMDDGNVEYSGGSGTHVLSPGTDYDMHHVFQHPTLPNVTPNNAIDMRQPSFAVVWIMSIV